MVQSREATPHPAEKLGHLREILQGMDRVTIAFSGGIDSSFLLHSACLALGANKVAAFQAVSCLTGGSRREKAGAIIHQQFADLGHYREVEVDPLSWPEVCANTRERCYFCKSRLYRIFLAEIKAGHGGLLLDGTQVDDLNQDRPGLRAIRELGVRTPLLEAGLTKREIRAAAREAGLPHHDRPADSCLATRLAPGQEIVQGLLEIIDKAEDFLEYRGFFGTRVRLMNGFTHLEIGSEDMARFSLPENRLAVQHLFTELGLGEVFLKITGR
jgi:uncharacterized protein